MTNSSDEGLATLRRPRAGPARRPVVWTTLSQKIRRALEQEIILGDLRPLDRIDETLVAQRFKASRTPVREALQGLAASGLVELRPRHGAVVAELTLATLVEMFEAMAAVEGFCARLAARRISPGERAALQAAHDACVRCADAGDTAGFLDANDELHEIICAACRNGTFIDQARLLRARLAPYRRYATFHPGRMTASLDEHATVIKAIADGDADRAEATMRVHLALLSEGFADLSAAMRSGGPMVPAVRRTPTPPRTKASRGGAPSSPAGERVQ